MQFDLSWLWIGGAILVGGVVLGGGFLVALWTVLKRLFEGRGKP